MSSGLITLHPRGRSLENELRQLINDNRFFDITLKCSDGKELSGCKAILATRSDTFNSLIFIQSKWNVILSFDNINSNAMKIILDYLYTSKVEENNVTINNVIEVYHASIYFKLIGLQKLIIDHTRKFLEDEHQNIGKILLSQCVEKFSLRADNKMSRILIDRVSREKLESYENDENDSLSLEGLRYLLMKTFDAQTPFATPEFSIWEYALKKVIKSVTKNKQSNLAMCNSCEVNEVKHNLSSLIDHINLRLMDAAEINQHIDPLNVFPM